MRSGAEGVLTREQVARYREEGYLSGLDLLTVDEVAGLRRGFDAYTAGLGGAIERQHKHKVHLAYAWADGLVHHPRLLDAVGALLGDDLLCWTSNIFVKEAGSPAFVSWHRDAAYWGLEPDEVVTAWVALAPSTKENGSWRSRLESNFMPPSARKPS